ncbi:MAG: hypothetical protein J6252_06560 [Clostridia bacterium]|nr:hypothetical protein [Clostridia bacterium]
MKRFATKNKKRLSAGFTLAEALIVLLIILMVTSIVVAGVPAAANALEKSVSASNAQVLLTTTVTKLRGELGSAREIFAVGNGSADDTICYIDENGVPSRISSGKKEDGGAFKGMKLTRYKGTDIGGDADKLSEIDFVSDKAANENLFVEFRFDGYADGVVTLKDVCVHKKNQAGDVIASLETLNIRVSQTG